MILPAQAQVSDRPSTVLVLDASGSMWGQIDGVNKIVIARDVIGDLLTRIPEDMNLGLTMYGHRRRGDCSDIEVMVEPGTGNRAQIAQIVNAVNPRGRTPLSQAVLQAAQSLRYTENAATVILVSDGRETCDLDPCAVGAELEATGIDFTAHVVGFDVADPTDIAQLQCLANNTGGRYLSASNAQELADALEEVAVAPEPAPIDVSLRAGVGEALTPPTTPLVWEVFDMDGNPMLDATQAPSVHTQLPVGRFRVQIYRMETETEHGGTIDITAPGPLEFIFPLPELAPLASVTGPAEGIAGSTVSVAWAGPNIDGDHISVAEPDSAGTRWIDYAYTLDGTPATLRLPPDAGTYEYRYILEESREILARQTVNVLPAQATLEAPASVVAGAPIPVSWTGPDYPSDYITISRLDDESGYENFTYTNEGADLTVTAPPLPGNYELRYVMEQGRTIIARRPIEVTQVQATLGAPATVPVGASFMVNWTGPDYSGDYITISRVDDASGYESYAYTDTGPSLTLTAPATAGSYELRYVMEQDRTIIARQALEVTEILATVSGAQSAPQGTELSVSWTGPAYARDFIGIRPEGDATGYYRWTETSEVSEGSPLMVQVPSEAGAYQVEYVLGEGREALASYPLTVEASAATLSAANTVQQGGQLSVSFTGPELASDFIGIVPESESSGYYRWTRTAEVSAGSPLVIDAPSEAGGYRLEYISTSDRVVLASQFLRVEPVTASVSAAQTAPQGGQLSVTWTGPAYDGDFIGIVPEGESSGYYRWTRTEEVSAGSPLTIELPSEAGGYRLEYVSTSDRVVLASQFLRVESVSATVAGPGAAPMGSSITVNWTGPALEGDFIGVVPAGDTSGFYRWTASAPVSDGSPLTLLLPPVAGEYRLEYVFSRDRLPLATMPLSVSPVSATIAAPSTGAAGSQIAVNWTGPRYEGDFIALTPAGEDGYYRFSAQTPLAEGATVVLTLPDEPGSYTLDYVIGQDRVTIASQPFRVE